MHDTKTMAFSKEQPALFQRGAKVTTGFVSGGAVTFSERPHESGFDEYRESKIRRSTRETNKTETRSTLVPFRRYRRELPEPSRTGANSEQR